MIKAHSKQQTETIYILLLAVITSGFFVWKNNYDFKSKFLTSVPILSGNSNNIVSPVPSSSLDIETASISSPDGTKKLNLKIVHLGDGSKTYIFKISDALDKNQKLLFQKTLASSESLGLPFNAFSPDNKYVFIEKNNNNALVFKTSGEPFSNKENFFDVENIFIQKNKTNKLLEVTGWASESLLILNTLDPSSNRTSFWLEIPSKAIIPLASQF